MAGQIRMTPDQMVKRAGEYSAEGAKLGEIIKKMDVLLKELQGEWEGSASEAYVARFGELRPNFTKAQKLIEEISSALKNTAKIVQQTDSDIARQFKA